MAFDPADEANQLANLFYSLSQATDDLRLGGTLVAPSVDDLASLKDQADRLDNCGHSFTAQAIGATLANIQDDLANIKNVTADAKAQLGKLTDVSKAIAAATAGVALGLAITSGNPATILAATGAFATAVAGSGAGAGG